MSKIIVSEFTRRITLISYDFTQGLTGGTSTKVAESFDTWAKWEQKSGGTNINQAQMMSDQGGTFTIRYRPQVTLNWNIVYEGQIYIINKINIVEPWFKKFMEIDVSSSIAQTSWS